MDDSIRQVSIIKETTEGTTPSTPTWVNTRNVRIEGGLETPRGESDERQANAQIQTSWKMTQALSKQLELRLAYDGAFQTLLESVMDSTWSSNVLKFGVAKQPFSVEEKWVLDDASLLFRRSTGCAIGAMNISIRNNEMSRVSCTIVGMDESTATTAIAGATYTAASTGNIMVPADAVVNDILGVTTPRMMSMDLSISNGARGRYAWGSAKAFNTGRGRRRVSGRGVFYFDAVAQYTALKAMPSGDIDVTLGDTTSQKFRILIPNARASNVSIPDGGEGDSMLAFDFIGEWDATAASSFQITRAVA